MDSPVAPVPGTWTVCRRELASVAEVAGSGAWVLEFPSQAPDPPPLTSIAWRLTHLHDTHHCAEVGCMRDLFRQLADARPTATRTRHG